ncbi:hypothetical protein [Rothia uropygialis]|uniref:hypothetical protein n=1 Tax=Kocuria sp. 36 TaxID=1415402 RepID=UPI00101BB199|nr:hypothetical protein [Kocuria sp. 36]
MEEQRDRINEQVAVVRHTLGTVKNGRSMTIKDIFAGADHSQYETEVRTGWGDKAWERSGATQQLKSEGDPTTNQAAS